MENRRPTPEQTIEELVKNGWEEQLIASFAMYRQRDQLPAEMVQPHIDILQYWGLIGQVISASGENTVDK